MGNRVRVRLDDQGIVLMVPWHDPGWSSRASKEGQMKEESLCKGRMVDKVCCMCSSCCREHVVLGAPEFLRWHAFRAPLASQESWAGKELMRSL